MILSETKLRELIRSILEKKDLIVEPDFTKEKEENEASVAGAVAGVTVPLGADSTYPNKRKKKKKPAHVAAGKSFGNAKLAK